MPTSDIQLHVAPLQGYTDAAFRHYHALTYGIDSAITYTTPFLRAEGGSVSNKSLKELDSPLNTGINIIPQIIFRDEAEFSILCDAIASRGYKHISLNLGCPFSPQVNKGRGAGMLRNIDELYKISQRINGVADLNFSIKMRLGVSHTDEWKNITSLLNETHLESVTLHPRTAAEQYKGELHIDAFAEFIANVSHPVIYNGEIRTPEDIQKIAEQLPGIAGIMIGRGLLARPSLISEWQQGSEWSNEQKIEKILTLHSAIYDQYKNTLCGDSQILMKIKTFWEYLEHEIGHKEYKQIKKATTLTKYNDAVTAIH